MTQFSLIEIFTSENARTGGQPTAAAVVDLVRDRKIAARCLVFKAVAGCYENGETATPRIELLSFNMPVKIEIVLPAVEADRLLPELRELVADGIVCARELSVVSHRGEKRLIPTHLLVRDIMSPAPVSVNQSARAGGVMKLLLSARFNGVPVVDEGERPVGIITQGDLISRGGMPLRLGLLSRMGSEEIEALARAMDERTAVEVMSSPPAVILENRPVTEAVTLMLERSLKRLPVVDADGKLAGVLSRLDIFRTISHDAPKWKEMEGLSVTLNGAVRVRDVMLRDTDAVGPDAGIEEVIRMIEGNGVQRLAVVDREGRLQGMVFDHDLLGLFASAKVGLWDLIVSRLTFTELGRRHRDKIERAGARTAGDLMRTDLVTIREDEMIEDAIRLMTGKGFKRLPVVDETGKYKGMASRDALLRAGAAAGVR